MELEGDGLKLLEANLSLITELARQYGGRGIADRDLWQAGILGLIQAVLKFDPDGGYEFRPFASFWVRKAINREFRDNENPEPG